MQAETDLGSVTIQTCFKLQEENVCNRVGTQRDRTLRGGVGLGEGSLITVDLSGVFRT